MVTPDFKQVIMSCRNTDGGFGHFPQWYSDMDAVYFQFGTLIQAGRLPSAKRDLADPIR